MNRQYLPDKDNAVVTVNHWFPVPSNNTILIMEVANINPAIKYGNPTEYYVVGSSKAEKSGANGPKAIDLNEKSGATGLEAIDLTEKCAAIGLEAIDLNEKSGTTGPKAIDRTEEGGSIGLKSIDSTEKGSAIGLEAIDPHTQTDSDLKLLMIYLK